MKQQVSNRRTCRNRIAICLPAPEVEPRAGTRAPAEVSGLTVRHGTPTVYDLAAGTEVITSRPPARAGGRPSVTIGLWPDGDVLENAVLGKLFQVPLAGGSLRRYSRNRGMQDVFSAGEGSTLVWLDGTDGAPAW